MALVVYLVKGGESETVVRYRFGPRQDETPGILELDKLNGAFRLVTPSHGAEAANEYKGARYAIARHKERADGYPDRLSFMS